MKVCCYANVSDILTIAENIYSKRKKSHQKVFDIEIIRPRRTFFDAATCVCKPITLEVARGGQADVYKGQSGRPKCQPEFPLRAPLAGELRGLAVSTVTAERDIKYSARLPAASDTLPEQKIKHSERAAQSDRWAFTRLWIYLCLMTARTSVFKRYYFTETKFLLLLGGLSELRSHSTFPFSSNNSSRWNQTRADCDLP